MRRAIVPAALLSALAALGPACARRGPELPPPIPPVRGVPRAAFTLRYIDVARGTGAPAEATKCLYAHYTGWLTNGTKFDSSRDTTPAGAPRPPIAFPQGARRVIAGWDAGFEGMRVGGRRRLFIPYQLAYGERGRPPRIPPRATLVFDVELMAVADTLARADAAPPRTPAAAAPQCTPWAELGRGAAGGADARAAGAASAPRPPLAPALTPWARTARGRSPGAGAPRAAAS